MDKPPSSFFTLTHALNTVELRDWFEKIPLNPPLQKGDFQELPPFSKGDFQEPPLSQRGTFKSPPLSQRGVGGDFIMHDNHELILNSTALTPALSRQGKRFF